MVVLKLRYSIVVECWQTNLHVIVCKCVCWGCNKMRIGQKWAAAPKLFCCAAKMKHQPSSTRARKGHHSPQQLFHFLPRVLSTELMRGRCWRYYRPQKGRNTVRKPNQRNTDSTKYMENVQWESAQCGATGRHRITPDPPASPTSACVCAHNFFAF